MEWKRMSNIDNLHLNPWYWGCTLYREEFAPSQRRKFSSVRVPTRLLEQTVNSGIHPLHSTPVLIYATSFRNIVSKKFYFRSIIKTVYLDICKSLFSSRLRSCLLCLSCLRLLRFCLSLLCSLWFRCSLCLGLLWRFLCLFR